MAFINSLKSEIFKVNDQNFESLALKLFRFQAKNNPVYRQYLSCLKCDPDKITSTKNIPFLPISFFKSHKIKSWDFENHTVFESSGTTMSGNSRHYIEDVSFYQKVSNVIFNQFYGTLEGTHVFGLLPSYIERGNSSLVYMVDHFMNISGSAYSGFYLDKYALLMNILQDLRNTGDPVFLFGVTFALIDLADQFGGSLEGITIIETGGMKGRKKEMTREEVHSILKGSFHLKEIHSEYGMTELLSQAYAHTDGIFKTPPWMKVYIRDLYDPFGYENPGKAGGINIIDLANIHSCAFIETQDIGIQKDNGFLVLGRTDNSDLRGCNLLVVQEF